MDSQRPLVGKLLHFKGDRSADWVVTASLVLNAQDEFTKQLFLDGDDEISVALLERLLQQPGAGAGLGPERAAAAAGAQLNFGITIRSVFRLKDKDDAVGSACLVKRNGRRFVLTARHCMNPKPGEVIAVESFTVRGHPLRHVASFPLYDITVLQLGDSLPLPEALQHVLAFELTGSVGVAQGMAITLISFPLAADKTVQGVELSDDPITAEGQVSWLSDHADEAIGSYSGSLPNSSGGALSVGPPFVGLVGIHTGAIWHEQGRNPQDVTAAGDQDASGAGSCAPAAPGVHVMETGRWSVEVPVASGRSCGGRKRKVSGLASEQHTARAAEVQYCLDNVQHKGQMGTFVPAVTLCQLLDRCWELVRPPVGAEA